MSDMLIRNLSDQMRNQIRKAASASGRSLSDEAKHLIRKGLAEPINGLKSGHSAWDEIRDALGVTQLSDAENEEFLSATTAARRSGARRTPEFE